MPLAAVPTSREELRRSHADFAREQVHATFRDSSILNNVGSYPTFDHADLCVGKVLGEGGFCTVSEIIAFSMINDKKQKEVTKSRVPPPITVTTTTTIKSRPVKWRAASALPKSKYVCVCLISRTLFLLAGVQARGSIRRRSSSLTIIVFVCVARVSTYEHILPVLFATRLNQSRYAVKILSPQVVKEPDHFLQGIIDMAIETRLLSDMEHPNIVSRTACDRGKAAQCVRLACWHA
jgi:hypothetical protein